ncbi:MAG TPA: c-type cytochrome [Anaeromyxobacteraceae bacterium]|nr:c-type cytochrome [Anaeromyxobacteraceae bacterium]
MNRTLLAAAAATFVLVVAAALAVPRLAGRGAGPPSGATVELVAAGRRIFANRCWGCHHEIPLPGRIRGWTLAHAYETIGRLPSVSRAMPPFPGSDDERRALAAYLAAVGQGEAPWP